MDWTSVMPELLKQGTGYVLAAFIGWFAWQLYKENRQVYKDQLASQKTDIERMQTAFAAATAAQTASTDAMKQLKEVVETAVITQKRVR